MARAFAPTGDSIENGAKRTSAAGEFGRPSVASDTLPSTLDEVTGFEPILASFHAHRGHVDRQLGLSFDFSLRVGVSGVVARAVLDSDGRVAISRGAGATVIDGGTWLMGYVLTTPLAV